MAFSKITLSKTFVLNQRISRQVIQYVASFGIFVVSLFFVSSSPALIGETAYTAGELFHAAIKEGEIEDVKKLLANGFNPNQAFEDGITPLHLTVIHNQEPIAVLLIQNGANVHAKDATTQATPLHFATLYGRANFVTLLLANGANINEPMKFNITPLLVAAQFRQPQLIELLLQHKANINHSDEEGYTGLHFAAQNNDENSLRVLLKNGAKVNVVDKRGTSPLKIVQEKHNDTLINLLKEHGAKEKDK